MTRLAEDFEVAERVWARVGSENSGKHPSMALREAVDRELGLVPKPESLSAEEAVAVLALTEGGANLFEAYERLKRDRGRPPSGVHFSSESPEWYTPAHILERTAAALGGIDLDPCADPERHVPSLDHFTKEDDGLSREWRGRVYMNPPYGSEIGAWVRKLLAEYRKGHVTAAVALVPARTDTTWFYLLREQPRCFVRGRLTFSEHENAAPFPSAAFYLGPDPRGFVRAFGSLGDVYELTRADG
jgi:phage N-6-adenine-methyltransferase